MDSLPSNLSPVDGFYYSFPQRVHHKSGQRKWFGLLPPWKHPISLNSVLWFPQLSGQLNYRMEKLIHKDPASFLQTWNPSHPIPGLESERRQHQTPFIVKRKSRSLSRKNPNVAFHSAAHHRIVAADRKTIDGIITAPPSPKIGAEKIGRRQPGCGAIRNSGNESLHLNQ